MLLNLGFTQALMGLLHRTAPPSVRAKAIGLIGLMIRHATFIASDIARLGNPLLSAYSDSQNVPSLVSLLIDSTLPILLLFSHPQGSRWMLVFCPAQSRVTAGGIAACRYFDHVGLIAIFAGILKQLTELVVEDSVKMQRKAMASLGELLFFIASQEEVCFGSLVFA